MTNDDSKAQPDPHSPLDDSSGPAVVPPRPAAWQPLTPRGVAAFAAAGYGRLFVVQFVVALLAAGTIVWFLATAWFPTIREAIHQLPERGQIRGQHLLSPRVSSEALAAGHFLALVVDLDNRSTASPSSDVRVEFHRRDFEICSWPGCLVFPYPEGWILEFNRTELEPWWGAWEPILLGIGALLVVLWLLLSWALLATCWFSAARVVGYFADRNLTWGGSWRLASAALMPGALLLIAAMWLYGLRALDMIFLGMVVAFHVVPGLVYSCVSPLFLPRSLSAGIPPARNPFASPPTAAKPGEEAES